MFFVLNLHPHSNAIGLWCNGNTTVFGAVIQGSNPCGPTKNLSEMRGFFMQLIEILDLKSDNWSLCVIYQIFTNASVKKVSKAFSSVSAHSYQIGIDAF